MLRLFSLRRIIRAIERLASAAEEANVISRQRLLHDYPILARANAPRKVEISTPSVEDWQKRVDKEREEKAAGL